MKRFCCDKLQGIRSDIVQRVVKLDIVQRVVKLDIVQRVVKLDIVQRVVKLDIVQRLVKFVSVKHSLFQMQHECFKQTEDCSNLFLKRCSILIWYNEFKTIPTALTKKFYFQT